MQVYQVRPRVLMAEGKLKFPNRGRIELRFEPNPATGGVTGTGNIQLQHGEGRVTWTANVTVQVPPLVARRDGSDTDDRTGRFADDVISVSGEPVHAVLNGAAADHHEVGSSAQRKIPQTKRRVRVVYREIKG